MRAHGRAPRHNTLTRVPNPRKGLVVRDGLASLWADRRQGEVTNEQILGNGALALADGRPLLSPIAAHQPSQYIDGNREDDRAVLLSA